MFSLDATGPAASGMPKVAEKATMELVSLAFGAVGKLCDQHGKALSKAFGNFDRVVGLGWLVADALGSGDPPCLWHAGRGPHPPHDRQPRQPEGRLRRQLPEPLEALLAALCGSPTTHCRR